MYIISLQIAPMAKLVDAPDLGSGVLWRVSSSLTRSTKFGDVTRAAKGGVCNPPGCNDLRRFESYRPHQMRKSV